MIEIDNDNVGHGEFFVKSFDTDCFYKAKPSYYFGLNQEIAGLHADKKGCGIKKIYDEEGRTWIILRTRMRVYKYLNWTDTLTYRTWCQEAYRMVYAPRFIEVYDKKDNSKVFDSDTHWVIMDIIHKKPLRPSVFEDRLPAANKEKYYKSPEFPPFPTESDYTGPTLLTYPVQINYYDTDYNKHVNNISYINWAFDSFPKEFLDTYSPSFMDAKWERQSFLNDKLIVKTLSKSESAFTDQEPEFLSRVIREKEDGEEETVFEISSTWKRKD